MDSFFNWVTKKVLYAIEAPIIVTKFLYNTIKERIVSPKIYMTQLQEYYSWRTDKALYQQAWTVITYYHQYLKANKEIDHNAGNLRLPYAHIIEQHCQEKLENLKEHRELLTVYNAPFLMEQRQNLIEQYDNAIYTIERMTLPHIRETIKSLKVSSSLKIARKETEDRALQERESHIAEVNKLLTIVAQGKAIEQQLTTANEQLQNNNKDLTLKITEYEKELQAMTSTVKQLHKEQDNNNDITKKYLQEVNAHKEADLYYTEQLAKFTQDMNKAHLANIELKDQLADTTTRLNLIVDATKEKYDKLFAEHHLLELAHAESMKSWTQAECTNVEQIKKGTVELAQAKVTIVKLKLSENSSYKKLEEYKGLLQAVQTERNNLKYFNDALTNNKGNIIKELEYNLKKCTTHLQQSYDTVFEDVVKVNNNMTALLYVTTELDRLSQTQSRAEAALLEKETALTDDKDHYKVRCALIGLDTTLSPDSLKGKLETELANHTSKQRELKEDINKITEELYEFVAATTKLTVDKLNITESTKEINAAVSLNLETAKNHLVDARKHLDSVAEITAHENELTKSANPTQIKKVSEDYLPQKISPNIRNLALGVHNHPLSSTSTLKKPTGSPVDDNTNVLD